MDSETLELARQFSKTSGLAFIITIASAYLVVSDMPKVIKKVMLVLLCIALYYLLNNIAALVA